MVGAPTGFFFGDSGAFAGAETLTPAFAALAPFVGFLRVFGVVSGMTPIPQ